MSALISARITEREVVLCQLGRSLVDHAYVFLLHDKGASASVLCCVKEVQ